MKPVLFIDTATNGRHVVNLDTKAGREHKRRLLTKLDDRGRCNHVESEEEPTAEEIENLPEDDGTSEADDEAPAVKKPAKKPAKKAGDN